MQNVDLINTLIIGDILYKRKSVFEHADIYIGNNKIAHNSPDNNFEIIP